MKKEKITSIEEALKIEEGSDVSNTFSKQYKITQYLGKV